jgi:hypothetical protein
MSLNIARAKARMQNRIEIRRRKRVLEMINVMEINQNVLRDITNVKPKEWVPRENLRRRDAMILAQVFRCKLDGKMQLATTSFMDYVLNNFDMKLSEKKNIVRL